MELNPDFQEFLRSFVDNDVRFLIVGGYALAAHGHPRSTGYLDVWVWPTRERSRCRRPPTARIALVTEVEPLSH
jgi:hypothetical protein